MTDQTLAPSADGVLSADRIKALAERQRGEGGDLEFDLAGLRVTRADMQWLMSRCLDRADVGGTARPGMTLRRLDAEGADLSGLRMDGLDLTEARLENTNLLHASFRHAVLTGARLSGAECGWADFRGARLDTAELDRCGLMWAQLNGAKLGHASLVSARMPAAQLDGADLLQADLSSAYLGRASCIGANLLGAKAQDAQLPWCRLDRAKLSATDLRGATLWRARLDNADVTKAVLDNANLIEAHLEGANLSGASLLGANLSRAYLDGATDLTNIKIGDGGHEAMIVADVNWSDTNLVVFDWSAARQLGDETVARYADGRAGRPTKAVAYTAAARASRQVSRALSERGVVDDANRFAFRAQVAQRRALLHSGPRAFPRYLFSLFLSGLSGYGFRPARGLITYIGCIALFAALYLTFGPKLTGREAFVVSVTAFHGRGFFPGMFSPGDPLSMIAAGEAFIGLIVEVVLIATITQRLFGK